MAVEVTGASNKGLGFLFNRLEAIGGLA